MPKRSNLFGTATVASSSFVNLGEASKAKRKKYGNQFVVVDGIKFDSKREARHYELLKMRQHFGQISDLKLQVRYELRVNGILITTYTPDFEYIENGKKVVEDVKGVRTRMYVMRKKLMKALYGIEIVEIF